MEYTQQRYGYLCILLIISCIKMGYAGQSSSDSSAIKLTIEYNLSLPTDTLILQIGTTTINNEHQEFKAIRALDGTFVFRVKSAYSNGYLRLIKSRATRRNDNRILISNVLWESDDDVRIKIIETDHPKHLITRKFTGIGSAKYNAWEEIQQTNGIFYEKLRTDPGYSQNNLTEDRLAILNKFKSKISTLSYDVQKIDILMWKWIIDINKIKNTYPESAEQIEIAKKMKELYYPMKKWVDNEEALANSISFISFYTLYFSLYPAYSQGSYSKDQFFKVNINPKTSIQLISTSSLGKIRQSLLVYFLSMMGTGSNLEPQYKKVRNYFTENTYLQQFKYLLSKQEMNISEFSFVDTEGENIPLSDYLGKVVLLDTWFTGCGGCATYYKNVISKLDKYFENNDKVSVVSISSDASKNIWLDGVKRGIYANPKGINLYTGEQKMNHPLYRLLGINSAPIPILIDKSGIVKMINTAELFNYDALIQEIEKML